MTDHEHGGQPCDPSEEAAIRDDLIEHVYEVFDAQTGEEAVTHRGKAAIVERLEAGLAKHGLFIRFDPPGLRPEREEPNRQTLASLGDPLAEREEAGLRAALERLAGVGSKIAEITPNGQAVDPHPAMWHLFDDALEQARAALAAPVAGLDE